VRRIFDSPERYRELRAELAAQWRAGPKEWSETAQAVFEELGLDDTGWRSLLESAAFRALLEPEAGPAEPGPAEDGPAPAAAVQSAEHQDLVDQLVADVVVYKPDVDRALLERAFAFAARAHDGQQRRSGEPFIEHPFAVARILAELHLDEETLAAAMLHDVVE